MKNETIEERVKRILAELLGLKAADLTNETSFSQMGCDSLDGAEVVMACEEEFNITITDEEGETLKTVGDLVALIQGKVKQ